MSHRHHHMVNPNSSTNRSSASQTDNHRDTFAGDVAVCVSYIIHHTSYIIHHTSYIIHHTSCIIHHISYIIHHTSYIIHHTSHVIQKPDIVGVICTSKNGNSGFGVGYIFARTNGTESCHTSHITHHTSHITHITHHTSSHITHHTSHITHTDDDRSFKNFPRKGMSLGVSCPPASFAMRSAYSPAQVTTVRAYTFCLEAETSSWNTAC